MSKSSRTISCSKPVISMQHPILPSNVVNISRIMFASSLVEALIGSDGLGSGGGPVAIPGGHRYETGRTMGDPAIVRGYSRDCVVSDGVSDHVPRQALFLIVKLGST